MLQPWMLIGPLFYVTILNCAKHSDEPGLCVYLHNVKEAPEMLCISGAELLIVTK